MPVAVLALFVVRKVDLSFLSIFARRLLWTISIAGVVEIALNFAGHHAILQQFAFVSDGRLQLTTLEPNILGSSLAVLILSTLPRARWTWPNIILYTCAFVTFAGAGSKMPLIGMVVGLIVFTALRSIALGRSLSGSIFVPIWLGGVIFLVISATVPSVQGLYNKTLAHSGAIETRLIVNKVALERFKESPVIGRGPGDFAFVDQSLLAEFGAEDRRNLWIGQMGLAILHDSGVLGMFLYIVFLITLLSRGFSFIRAGSIDHCGFLAAFVSVFLSSQATTVHLNLIFGIAAGLLACAPVSIWTGYRRMATRDPLRRGVPTAHPPLLSGG